METKTKGVDLAPVCFKTVRGNPGPNQSPSALRRGTAGSGGGKEAGGAKERRSTKKKKTKAVQARENASGEREKDATRAPKVASEIFCG